MNFKSLKLKRAIIAVLCVLTSLFASFALIACQTDYPSSSGKKYEEGYRIVLDESLENGAEFDYAPEISLPGAVVKDKNGETVSYEIEYRVTDSENKTVTSQYSSFALKPGGYTITYYYNEQLKLDITFKVTDNIAPVISFRDVPNDLFVGVDENGFLPHIDIEDASEVETEVKLEFAAFGGEKQEVEYQKMNDSFAVTTPGVFTFTVTATDSSGNRATKSVGWIAKDPAWTDSALESGYYSDFGEEAYLNTVKSGDINKYWTTTDYTQEWLESFEGANGVLKLGLSFTDTQNTSIALKLSKPIKWADLKGKYILAKVYVQGEGLENYFGFGGNQKIQFENELSAATEKKSPLVTGKWVTYALDCDRAIALKMYSDANDDKDNPASDIKQIQFCFTRSDKTLARMYLYLDGISVAEKLPAVENVKAENGVLSWTENKSASAYRVNVNGTEIVTKETQVTLSQTKGYAFVSAIGDDKLYIESDKSIAVFGLTVKEGEYASFDDPLYEYLVDDDVNVGSETSGYKPTSLSVKYDQTNQKLAAVVGKGSWGLCTALALRLPAKVNVSGVNTISLGMTVDIPAGMCNEIQIFNYEHTKQLGKITVESGVTRYFIDVSGIDELSGFQFVYLNKVNGKNQDMGENKLTFTFDYIVPVTKLSAPVITVDNEDGSVWWDEVEHATGYKITINEETHYIETTSYTLPSGSGTVKVKAVGDDIAYFDSEESFAIYGLKARDGEYASFNSDLYDYLVSADVKLEDNNASMGYTPVSLTNTYENGKFTTVVGKGAWGICTAVAVRFPNKVNLNGVKYLVLGMNVTIESECKTLRVWSLENRAQLGEITVSEGKTQYVLDLSGNNFGEITGIEFIYLNRVDGNDIDIGERKITFSFDYIAPAVKLGSPALAIDVENGKVKWDAVDNACGYVVKVNDGAEVELDASVTEYAYPAGASGTVTVYAKGNGKTIFNGDTASIRFDSRTILENVTGITVSGNVLSWSAVTGAVGYVVRINGAESEVFDATSYIITTKGYLETEVKAVGDGVATVDGEYTLACTGDFFLEDGYLANYINGYEKLMDTVVPSVVVEFIEKGEFSSEYKQGEGVAVTVVDLWNGGTCTAFRIRFANDISGKGGKYVLKYKVTTTEGNPVSFGQFRVIDADGKGWMYEKLDVTFDGSWQYLTLDITDTAKNGLVYVFNGSSSSSITFTLGYLASEVKLDKISEIRVDNANKTISWDAVENASSYAIIKDGEIVDHTTELSYDCSELGAFTTLGVIPEGIGRFVSGDAEYASIVLDGTDWIESKGMLEVEKISWANKDLIQVKFASAMEYARDTQLKAGSFIITVNGKAFVVTDAYATDDNTKINIYGAFSTLVKGDVLRIESGTKLSGNGMVYGVSGSYTAIFAGEANDGYGTYNWCAVSGELSFAKTDWSTAGTIQIVFDNINEADQTVFDASGVKAFANGTALTFSEIRWHSSVKKLALSFGQPQADEFYGVPVITIKSGSFISVSGKAYVFNKDHMLAYSSVHDRWSLVSTPETVAVSWPEHSGSIQLRFDRDLWDGDVSVDASNMNVLSNGIQIVVNALKDSPAHIRIQGAFSTATTEEYSVPTLVIKAGSIAMLHNTSILFDRDITFVWNGENWTMA